MTERKVTAITVYFFFVENLFFYVNTNPTCLRYILHILHEYLSETNLSILNSKALRISECFISLGTKSHIFRPRQGNDSVPWQPEYSLLLLIELLLRRSYRLILGTKSSFTVSGATLVLTLSSSVARACIFL